MARAKKAAKFSSALLPFIVSMVRNRGADPSALVNKYFPDGDTSQDITTAQFRDLMNDAAGLLQDPLFGLHCAQAMPRGAYGIVEFSARSASSGRSALALLARYGSLINPAVRFTLEESSQEIAIHHRTLHDPEGAGRHGNHFTLARIFVMGREMFGESLKPNRVWFMHKEGQASADLVQVFGTRSIDFGRSTNGISFDRRELSSSPKGSDPELNRVLELQSSRLLGSVVADDVLGQSRRVLVELLPNGDASLAKTAKQLSLSPRTLQRRFDDEGLSFQELVSEVRKTQAEQQLLHGEKSVREIAELLGYSDAGSLLRAFRRWWGMTPGEWRAKHRRR
jgi:AraC-like DNA-binding protein